MRGNFRHLDTVNPVVFLNDMLHVLLPMKGDHWLIVLVEKQKSSISVYHRFYFRCYSIGKNTDQIIIHRQLKSRSQNTSDGVNRAVPSAIHLLKLDQPRLCIRQANLVNALLSKRFSVQDIDYGLISRLGVMTDTGFQRSIFLYQFNYRVIAATGNDMVKQIRLNLLFLLSQRKLSLFTPGSRVILVQTPTVHILLLTILVNISVTIPPICTLVFTFTQNPISIVSSFFTHRNLSFQNKESQTCSFILSQIRLSV